MWRRDAGAGFDTSRGSERWRAGHESNIMAQIKDPRVEELVELYKQAERFDRPFKRQCVANYRALHNILPDDWPYFTGIFEPYTALSHESILNNTMGQLFPKENYFDVEPEDGQDSIQTELMRLRVRNELRVMRYKVTKYFQGWEAFAYGNGIVRSGFKRCACGEVQPMRAIERVVSRFSFHPLPGGATMEELPGVFETVLLPVRTILAMFPQLPPDVRRAVEEEAIAVDDGQREVWIGDEERIDLYTRLEDIGYHVKQTGADSASKRAVKFGELLLCGLRPDLGEGCERFAILVNRQFIVQDGKNPFDHGKMPWSDARYQLMDPELWQGKGQPQALDMPQQKLNQTSAQIGDLIEHMVRPMKYVDKRMLEASRLDAAELRDWPDMIVPLSDINGVRRLDRDKAGLSAEIFKVQMDARADLQRISGVSDPGRGMLGASSGMGKGVETATGLAAMMRQQAALTGFKILLMEETGFKDALEKTASNIVQSMVAPEVLNVEGNETLEKYAVDGRVMLRPEFLKGRWKLKAVGSTRSMEDPESAQVLQGWLEKLATITEPGRLKLMEAGLDIGEMIRVPNPRKYVRTDDELAVWKMQQLPAGAAPMMQPAGVA